MKKVLFMFALLGATSSVFAHWNDYGVTSSCESGMCNRSCQAPRPSCASGQCGRRPSRNYENTNVVYGTNKTRKMANKSSANRKAKPNMNKKAANSNQADPNVTTKTEYQVENILVADVGSDND